DVFAGIERLAEHVAALPTRRRRPRDLCAEARRAMSDIVNEDDVTVLAVSCMPKDTTRRATLALSVDVRAPREARDFVREVLAEWGVGDELVDATQLCVSELVTNAVIHGGVDKALALELDDQGWLTALVHDSGGAGNVEHLADEDFSLVSGRGLTLVEAMSDDWGTDSSQDGTTVWCELRVVPEDARQRSDA
ncbi:MAG TPA: ATP-binding protein, partial [Thermomicrobiales bacterium]|nr:ATP-binding protein [Thermomicrobiales bacterium]